MDTWAVRAGLRTGYFILFCLATILAITALCILISPKKSPMPHEIATLIGLSVVSASMFWLAEFITKPKSRHYNPDGLGSATYIIYKFSSSEPYIWCGNDGLTVLNKATFSWSSLVSIDFVNRGRFSLIVGFNIKTDDASDIWGLNLTDLKLSEDTRTIVKKLRQIALSNGAPLK